ncbi:2444_t:CDS:1, partial [Entrophospora sp. SA101]
KNTYMVKAFGIDLGTTNSCAAIMQDGRVKIIVNKEGENTTPSVAFFNEEGEKVAVGQAAKSEAIKEPGRVIFEAKRLIGREFNDPQVQEFRKIAPFQIISGKKGAA